MFALLRKTLSRLVPSAMVAGVGALLLAAAVTTIMPVPAQAGVKLLMPVHKKPPALDFVLEDIDGNVWQLSRLKGKVVVINFWSISCTVCRVELPTLEEFWKKMSKMNVQVLTIHVGHDERDVRAFVRKHGLTLPVLHDARKHVARAWGVFSEPITFVLNPDGRVAYVAFGGRNWLNPSIARMILALQPPL